MNRAATREKFEASCLMLSKWCLKHGISYPVAVTLLKRTNRIMETREQRRVIEALKMDGLYVPSDDEQASA